MCDDDVEHTRGHLRAADGFTRRRMLQGMVGLAGLSAAVAACGPAGKSASVPLTSRGPNRDGLRPVVLAMHLHASASEGVGSMLSQLTQAAANGFDVAWFTEHDWRRQRLLFRPTYSFRPDDSAMGGIWLLPPIPTSGSATSDSGGQLVTDRVSPRDPTPGAGSLRLRAASTGASKAVVGHRVDATSESRLNYNARIAGRTVSVDVLPSSSGPDAWGEVLFRLSRHPGSGRRPEGAVSLLYRLRTDIGQRAVSSDGLVGIIDVPVLAGQWQTVRFDLTADVGLVWPDLDPRDNSLNDINLLAASRRQARAEVFYGFLRFDEQAGYDALGTEHALLQRYVSAAPHVTGLIGTEISLGPHLNQYGGTQQPYPYGPGTTLAQVPGEIRGSIVDFIHAHGGLASINHPFKPGDTSVGSTAEAIARDLLAIGAGGADILEVGYANKGGGMLADHLAVWDALSRNAVFLTGNGVSDDHTGHEWAQQVNRFYTATWAGARTETALLDSLARGRTYVGYLGSFRGTVDMSIDSRIPMGAVVVGRDGTRTLRIDVTGLPKGGAVQVVGGAVDYAGVSSPRPDTKVMSSRGQSDLDANPTFALDTREDCFVRLQVIDAHGSVVAFGQPTWLLRTPPPHGIPAARRA